MKVLLIGGFLEYSFEIERPSALSR
uniref:Uncharacterized protein n=1 Tax=Anguilla anguilla TaxID=7936 RepID=A0A0E9R1F8_ANGAN